MGKGTILFLCSTVLSAVVAGVVVYLFDRYLQFVPPAASTDPPVPAVSIVRSAG